MSDVTMHVGPVTLLINLLPGAQLQVASPVEEAPTHTALVVTGGPVAP